MCFQLFLHTNNNNYKESIIVQCDKCNYFFELDWGGKSKRTSCRQHHINKGGFCDHCAVNITDVKSSNCYHIARKTWWERLTGCL